MKYHVYNFTWDTKIQNSWRVFMFNVKQPPQNSVPSSHLARPNPAAGPPLASFIFSSFVGSATMNVAIVVNYDINVTVLQANGGGGIDGGVDGVASALPGVRPARSVGTVALGDGREAEIVVGVGGSRQPHGDTAPVQINILFNAEISQAVAKPRVAA